MSPKHGLEIKLFRKMSAKHTGPCDSNKRCMGRCSYLLLVSFERVHFSVAPNLAAKAHRVLAPQTAPLPLRICLYRLAEIGKWLRLEASFALRNFHLLSLALATIPTGPA